MKKIFAIIFSVIFTFFVCTTASEAKSKSVKGDFSSVINDSGIEQNSIAISIKELNSGKAVYELNEKILLHPASVQKVLTMPPAIEVLGDDYEFETTIYKRSGDEFLIKLGADPYLSSNDLKKLVNNMKQDTKTVYIDDSILEKKDWGEGWQWDDDMNILMPRFNSYNLDKNLLRITVTPTEAGQPAVIINPSKYPIVFINQVVTGDENNIQARRDNSFSANTLILKGTVNKAAVKQIPVNNLKRYFDVRLTNTLSDKNIYLKQDFINDRAKPGDEELDKITHPLSNAVKDVLKNSNNMIAETVFKLAGGKACNSTGTDVNGIKVFNSYCEKIGLDSSSIRITDASGVSKNNLISADFISEFLVKSKNNEILENLPSPGEGTLTHRMLPLKDCLKAKTGTHGDTSAIAGFLTARSGKKYAFCIIINDTKSTVSEMKTLEDYLIREVYLKF